MYGFFFLFYLARGHSLCFCSVHSRVGRTNTQAAEKLQLMGREKDCQRLHRIIKDVAVLREFDKEDDDAADKEREKKEDEDKKRKEVQSHHRHHHHDHEEPEKKEPVADKTTVILLSGEAGIGMMLLNRLVSE